MLNGGQVTGATRSPHGGWEGHGLPGALGDYSNIFRVTSSQENNIIFYQEQKAGVPELQHHEEGPGLLQEEAGPIWLLPPEDASRQPARRSLPSVRASQVGIWHQRAPVGQMPVRQMAVATSICLVTGTGAASEC